MPEQQTLTDHLRETERFSRRTLAIALGCIFFSLLLIVRLSYLQLYQHHRYTTLSQHNQLNIVPLKPNRGLIYDRNGVLLAENIPVSSLEITLDRIPDLEKTIKELRQIIPITDEQIEDFYKQAKQHRIFDAVPLRLKLSEEEIARFSVNQHRFPGVAIKARLIRHYPLAEQLSHVLGYVGRINERELQQIDQRNYRANNFIGKVGIEKFYEEQLHGATGYQQAEIDASGRVVRVIHRNPPTPGANLHLTIDSHLSNIAQQALGNQRGAVVAIDPNNGDVIALVSNPSYDPNPFVTGISHAAFNKLSQSDEHPMYNRSIRGQYPLGSTIKPFLSLEALDDKIVTTDYKFWDPGWFRLPNSRHLYRDDWGHTGGRGHGWIKLKRAITVSCDTYFYQLAVWLGITRIDSILTKFGFGIASGIDLGEELSGLVPSPAWKLQHKGKSWYPGDTVISGIGQGFLLTTPLQLASATATLARHGKRVRPHLLNYQSLTDKTQIPYESQAVFPVRLKHNSVWKPIIDAMRDVIRRREGTGHRFGRDAPYSVAGKTGTVQVFSIKQDAQLRRKNIPQRLRDHSLFMAFAPIKHPKIAIAVVVENSPSAPTITRKVLDAYFKVATS